MEYKKAKEGLGKQEEIRKEIKERKVNARGGESKLLKDYLDQAENLLEELRQTPEGKNNEEKIRELAKELGIENEELKEYFEKGLRFNIKAAYRLGDLPQNPTSEEEFRQILETLITGYVLNFRSTLHHYLRKIEKEKYEITPKTILQIASHVYIFPPRVIDELEQKFPDIDYWMIKRSVVYYSNPEEFLRKVKINIEEIKNNPEFQDMDDSIIKHAVTHNPTNPEEFLRKFKTKIEEIKNNPEFQDIDYWIINHAVVNYPPSPKKPNNPEEFLRKVKERLNILEQQYPQLNLSLRKELAIYFPNTFLEKAQELIEGKLKEEE
ncbi:MAG: hypothetical protein KatS3mg094_062 [Candidatus Parcubacteria bacterium]|nr:MAG: hypothetical protein KatS3mg094_062 [Candidatus Parcubacteria bacterium]